MNFADYIKQADKEQKETMREKYGMDPFSEWKKPLTPKNVADAMCAAAGELAEEFGDAEIHLLNILLTTETVTRLFPREEFKKLMERQKAETKGENDGSK